jgi:two-component system, NarL family, response regulator LiaR
MPVPLLLQCTGILPFRQILSRMDRSSPGHRAVPKPLSRITQNTSWGLLIFDKKILYSRNKLSGTRGPMSQKTTAILFCQEMELRNSIIKTLQGTTFSVIGSAQNLAEAYVLLIHSAPDVIILQINERCQQTRDIIHHLKKTSPRSKILFLQRACNHGQIVEAIKAGVSFFMPETLEIEDLPRYLIAALRDEIVLPPFVAESLMQACHQVNASQGLFALDLTKQEKVILQGISKGLSFSDLHFENNFSQEMIKAHLNNILHKIHFSDIAKHQYQGLMDGHQSYQ